MKIFPIPTPLHGKAIWLLLPFGLLHWLIVTYRNYRYDRQRSAIRRLPVPVVSIGNIQLGGTGKTPLTIKLIKSLQATGLRIGVLTRGYRRQNKQIQVVGSGETTNTTTIGDEPMLLLKHLRNGAIAVGADRYTAGMALLREYQVDLFLVDDGFQHRRLHRDLDICLIDLSRWRRHPFLFPFSYLRDTKGSLRRADFLLLNKAASGTQVKTFIKNNSRYYNASEIFEAAYKITGFRSLQSHKIIPTEDLVNIPVAGSCAIANPQHFRQMLIDCGLHIAQFTIFPDHHNFSQRDMEALAAKAKAKNIRHLIITGKDAVKIRETQLTDPGNPQIMESLMEIELAPEKSFEQMLNRIRQLAASGEAFN